jgi:hypothetical protein
VHGRKCFMHVRMHARLQARVPAQTGLACDDFISAMFVNAHRLALLIDQAMKIIVTNDC